MQSRDVIAAIATAPAQGAIGIVRISGDKALDVLCRVFRSSNLLNFESHRMYYGSIIKGDEVIDEVMVCYMKSPRSFTREDSVEIYAHGGIFILSEVLGAVISAGARLAEPGEFTKRAFLNGRINLSEAEAVMDLISAKTSAARRTALKQLGGGLSRRIESVRDKILSWLAHIELSIDYPEHEDEARNAVEILSDGDAVIQDLRRLSETADIGRIIREGVRTAIIGRPNVGKSTLLNAILHENRAIVHETAGTTRDVLTEEVRVADIPLIIMDTAGLRETDDPIEKIGIEKTHDAAQDAELILYIADATQGLTSEDMAIIKKFSQNKIILMNKSDLKHGAEKINWCRNINISAKTGAGLDELFSYIKELFLKGNLNSADESEIITRERHKILLEEAIVFVEKAFRELRDGIPEDLVSVSLRAAYISLGEILGVEIGDDIVDRIFSEFCVGK
ncbi:MAG: tRNA uridine-5-carboxymethylaminomethyl(34) synthesis GTPase MnmE [Defluviitaleaceae bacterium]|nr:tRNA uridine-5-carboxymethylaminomethyl(34) synthesis GTPase MnmE [Defluviitaleaceae bacterium]